MELEGSDLEPVSFQGQLQGVKVAVGSGDTSPSENHSSAGKCVRTCRREQGWGQWVAERDPAPLLAGVEVRHSAPAPAAVGEWQGPATLCWAVRARHFVKLHWVHLKKTQKIHSRITVFSPK